jgi:cobalt/nickel transport system permease protein
VAGTSGHFLGALLAAALLGPWAATLALTVIVIVQGLVMADGGVTAMGANITNMAVIAVFAGYGCFLVLKRILPRTSAGYLVSVAVASWLSVVAAGAACALELGLSGTIPLETALPTMVSVHMVIGVGEALISAAVVSAVLVARPDLVKSFDLPRESVRGAGTKRMSGKARLWSFVVVVLVVAAALALFVSPFASSSPDGLETVLQDQGALAAGASGPQGSTPEGSTPGAPASEEAPVWNLSPMGSYRLPGVESEAVSTGLAGLIGVVGLFVIVVGAGRVIGRRRTESG